MEHSAGHGWAFDLLPDRAEGADDRRRLSDISQPGTSGAARSHRQTNRHDIDGRRDRQLEALRRESDRAEVEHIRHWLRLPPEKRTNFLRKRIGIQSSCL
jgi:hypothetical protein